MRLFYFRRRWNALFYTQLLIGTLIVILMTIFHVLMLVGLSKYVDRKRRTQSFNTYWIKKSFVMGVSVLSILAIHTFESWAWAAIYYYLGEFSDPAEALYFSIVTATTLGYGDITLSEQWRLLASIEAMGGMILFGVSVAFLIEVVRFFFEGSQKSN
jgi:hypothetical protein